MKETYGIVWNANDEERSSVYVRTNHFLKGPGRIAPVQCALIRFAQNDSPAHHTLTWRKITEFYEMQKTKNVAQFVLGLITCWKVEVGLRLCSVLLLTMPRMTLQPTTTFKIITRILPNEVYYFWVQMVRPYLPPSYVVFEALS